MLTKGVTHETGDLAERLRAMGRLSDKGMDLAEAALLLGALDRPDVDIARYRKHVEDLVQDTADAGREAGDAGAQAVVLSRVLSDLYGYDGDQLTFDDPRNANLTDVIDRRRGLPVSLGILYIRAGRAQGWTVNGLNFPGHFLVCVGKPNAMVVTDPFHSGRVLTDQELDNYMQRVQGPGQKVRPADLGVMSNRAVLIRLLSNIRQRALKAGDDARALEIAERMVMVAPEHPAVLYDYGMQSAGVGHLALALETLKSAADFAETDAARHKALKALESVKRRLN